MMTKPTFDFGGITEVSLAHGSHGSPEQGLCFMEMVAWFAGEKHSDKPACACPVLGSYGIGLNDRMPDGLRNELLKPLVPMIAGTKGARADEQRRAEFLAMWSINKIIPIALRAAKLEEHAVACESATTLPDAAYAAKAAAYAAYAADAAAYAADAAYAAKAAAYAAAYAADAADAAADAADAAKAAKAAAYAAAYAADAAAYAADAAAYAADAAAYAADAADAAYAAYRREIFSIAVEGLRQAILIGPHEGFDRAIDLTLRHEALVALVTA
jgi:hypothetical protein